MAVALVNESEDISSGGDIGDTFNGYIYFYNLGHDAKYSFITQHSALNVESSAGNGFAYFGIGAYTVTESINAIRLFNYNTGGNFQNKGTFSLYGIEEYS
jgi:hypothetical protein